MADQPSLGELARQQAAKRGLTVDPNQPIDLLHIVWGDTGAPAAEPRTPASYNTTYRPQPGDPDYRGADYVDPLVGAKQSLANANRLQESSGWNRAVSDSDAATAQRNAQDMAEPSGAIERNAFPALRAATSSALHTPLAVLNSFLHPQDAATPWIESGKEAWAHPEEIGPAFLQGAADPEVMGAAAGQLATLPMMEGVRANPGVAAGIPGQVGRGVATGVGTGFSKIGNLMERGGQAVIGAKTPFGSVPALGMMDLLLRGDPKGLAVAAAPYVIRGMGRGIQRLGGALKGLGHGPAEAVAEEAAQGTRSAATGPYETADLYDKAQQAGYSDTGARRAAGMPSAGKPAAAAAPAPSAGAWGQWASKLKGALGGLQPDTRFAGEDEAAYQTAHTGQTPEELAQSRAPEPQPVREPEKVPAGV